MPEGIHAVTGYPMAFVRDESGDLRVMARDWPEIVTWGADETEALAMAEDALDVVVGAALDDGREVPPPSALRPGETFVPLKAALGAKVAVYTAWMASGLSKSDLARRLGVAEGEVRRILDPRHGTRLETLDAAARALGARLVVHLDAA